MGIFEKRRAKKFLEWVGAFKEEDSATHNGIFLAALYNLCATALTEPTRHEHQRHDYERSL